MRAGAALLAMLAASATAAAAPQSPPRLEPGVSQELARWRAQHYRDLRYALEVGLDLRRGRADGKLDLRVTLARRTDLVLDWRGAPVRGLRVNGKPATARQARQHLVIPRTALRQGENRVELQFRAPLAVSGQALTLYRDREDGAGYVYTLLVPADASSLFPCFDQPDLKGRFTLRLRLPRNWRAVSNAPLLEEAPGRARFAETEPISTYLFAFAAGPFERLSQPDETVRLWVRRSQLERARAHAGEVRPNDRVFQHIAIIVRDMEQAYQHLRRAKVEHASTGPQRLPDWNPNAGGISAFYFRDPDGHFLEILHFPPGKGLAKWQQGSGLFLGIDHTAIVVDDTDRSLQFYRDALSLEVAGASENYDTEQEHLNNVFGARLRITALRAREGPGIELLEYLAPRDGRPAPLDLRANDIAHWQTTLLTAAPERVFELLRTRLFSLVSPSVVQVPAAELGLGGALLLRDPDGHGIRVALSVEPTDPRIPAP
jgi:catechol 2,3-dioxygenase-like lactoylglutathione lyase family enzyme